MISRKDTFGFQVLTVSRNEKRIQGLNPGEHAVLAGVSSRKQSNDKSITLAGLEIARWKPLKGAVKALHCTNVMAGLSNSFDQAAASATWIEETGGQDVCGPFRWTPKGVDNEISILIEKENAWRKNAFPTSPVRGLNLSDEERMTLGKQSSCRRYLVSLSGNISAVVNAYSLLHNWSCFVTVGRWDR